MRKFIIALFAVIGNSLAINAQEKWTCYTDDNVLLMDDNHEVLTVFEYIDGSLWVITERGINVFDGKQWERIDQKNDLMRKKIASYLVDSKDRIWIGTDSPQFVHVPAIVPLLYHGGVVVYDGNKWESILTKDMGIKRAEVSNMFEASSGDIWLTVVGANAEIQRLSKGALVRYVNNDWVIYRPKDIPCNFCEFVKGFYEDDNGRIYFWSDSGMFYFEDNGFTEVSKNDGYDLGDREVTASFTDSKKNLWLAARARVVMYDGLKAKSFGRKNGLPEASWAPLAFDEMQDGTVILLMMNGLYVYNGTDKWQRFKFRSVMMKEDNDLWQYFLNHEKNGDLWVGYRNNFGKFDGKKLVQEKKNLSGNMYIDKQNRLWVPTTKGLEIKDGESWSIQEDVPKIWSIINDKSGGVWALSKKDGVKRHKDGKWSHFTDKNELPSDKIKLGHVTEDGTIWIGTSKGICKCEYN